MTADPFRGLPGPSYLSYPLGSNPSFVDLLRASSNGPDPRADSAGQNAPPHIPAPHGTTVLALKFANGIVIAGDARAVVGYAGVLFPEV